MPFYMWTVDCRWVEENTKENSRPFCEAMCACFPAAAPCLLPPAVPCPLPPLPRGGFCSSCCCSPMSPSQASEFLTLQLYSRLRRSTRVCSLQARCSQLQSSFSVWSFQACLDRQKFPASNSQSLILEFNSGRALKLVVEQRREYFPSHLAAALL